MDLAESQPTSAEPLHILIVEDSVETAETMALLLGLYGHEVRLAHDGPTALRLAHERAPDAVLLDIALPKMDGYELARRLRQQSTDRQPLLVAVTGYGQEEDRRRSREAGFDHHMVKPIDPGALQALLAGG